MKPKDEDKTKCGLCEEICYKSDDMWVGDDLVCYGCWKGTD